MRTPLSARIGLYLILAGLTFDLILHYAGGVEYLVPGIGAFSILLFPLGLILLAGTAMFQLIALRRERVERISLTSPGPQSGELRVGHGKPLSLREQRVGIGSPLRLSAWVGLGLTFLGIASFTCIQYWMATPTFAAVDMPVSLAFGRIQALWLSVLSIAVGTSLLVLFRSSRSTKTDPPRSRDITASETISPYFQWAQKLPLKPAITGLPSFGLVCALVLSWLVMLPPGVL